MKNGKRYLLLAGSLIALPLASCSFMGEESTSSSSSQGSSSSWQSSSSQSASSSSSSSEENILQASVVFGETTNPTSSTSINISAITCNGIEVSSVSAAACYAAAGEAARFSSSKNDGYLILNFVSSVNIRSLKAYAFRYSSGEEASLALSADSLSATTKEVTATSYSDNNYLLFENVGLTSFLRIDGTKKKRFYLAKLELEIVSSEKKDDPIDEKGYYEVSLSSIQKYQLDNFEDYGVLGAGNLPSIGSPKLLVVPVYFSGENKPTSSEVSIIQNAFFGEENSTGWESLSSYYRTSSYGKLNISGTVTDPFEYSLSSDDFQKAYEKGEGKSGYKDTDDILTDVVSWAKSKGYLNQSFDSNNDGYIDGIDLIYFTDKSYDDNADLWWAYTTGMNMDPNKSDPVPNRYFWSPMSMIANGYYDPDIDTHTLIHETGHMLGLDDYYSYDTDDNGNYSEAPCGMVDMMDCNVGDHNAYSKMLLGWCAPKVVNGTGSFSITLNSFTETGDFLLIPSRAWNGTPYDEYVILQYYTPTGLNEQDSSGYPEFSSSYYGHGGTYASSGLQAFHVDSRVFSYVASSKGYSNIKYSDDPTFLSKTDKDGSILYNGFIAASNTGSYSLDVAKSTFNSDDGVYGSSNRLISILPADGSSSFLKSDFEGNFGLMKNLYTVSGNSSYTNAKLAKCYQNNGKFNNGDLFPYSFNVSNQTSSSICVNFTHI